MKSKHKDNRYGFVALVTGVVILIPLVAMQFTDEVDWGLLDFAVMGSLLLSTGIIIDNVLRKTPKNRRFLYAGLVLITFLLVWAELAVGVFGTPFAGS